ncbi:MAG TPA: hypothetical protein PKA64_02080 [Myxococcota bacterium]|nr:hypothetical protein [Myxococcota bacterium]
MSRHPVLLALLLTACGEGYNYACRCEYDGEAGREVFNAQDQRFSDDDAVQDAKSQANDACDADGYAGCDCTCEAFGGC